LRPCLRPRRRATPRGSAPETGPPAAIVVGSWFRLLGASQQRCRGKGFPERGLGSRRVAGNPVVPRRPRGQRVTSSLGSAFFNSAKPAGVTFGQRMTPMEIRLVQGGQLLEARVGDAGAVREEEVLQFLTAGDVFHARVGHLATAEDGQVRE